VSGQHEARVSKVQQELTEAVKKCETLEQKGKEQAEEMTSLKVVVTPWILPIFFFFFLLIWICFSVA
jgi:hypothetical protein